MNRPLSEEEKRIMAHAPRIWVSYPDGRKLRIVDPEYMKRVREERQANVFVPVDFRPGHVSRTTAKAIIASVAKATGISVEDMIARKRTVPVVRARNAAMYLCSVKLGMSFPKIGVRFDRDHTTVLHGVKKHISERRKLGRRVPDAQSV